MRSFTVTAAVARLAPLAALVLAACSSSGSSAVTLDCAYLASADNCWKQSVAAAATCVPSASAVGTLSADKKTCTYADGTVVTFDPAFDPTAKSGSFTITSGGKQCLHFQGQEGAGLTLTTSLGTFQEAVTGVGGVTLTCPDGSAHAGDGFSLLSCPSDGGSFGGLPGTQTNSSTSPTFSLLNGPTGTLLLFSCK
jgi:hypothetical protein